MDANALISVLQTQGGLDVTSATALELINAVYQPAVALGRYRLAEYTLATTVAAQDHYTLDDQTVVSIEEMMVNAIPYDKTSVREVWELKYGTKWLSDDTTGVFAEAGTTTGGVQFQLYPAPTSPGLIVTGLVVLEAVALDTGSNVNPIIPVDLHDQLADAAIALGKARLNSDVQASQMAVQLRDDLGDKLKRRRNARLRSVELDLSGL